MVSTSKCLQNELGSRRNIDLFISCGKPKVGPRSCPKFSSSGCDLWGWANFFFDDVRVSSARRLMCLKSEFGDKWNELFYERNNKSCSFRLYSYDEQIIKKKFDIT